MQRVAVDMYKALQDREGISVVPFVLKTSWKDTSKNAKGFFARLLWQLPKILKKEKIDVVVFSSMVTATTLLLRAPDLRKQHVRSVVIVHGQDVTLPNKYYQRLVRKVFKKVDLVAPVSDATANECFSRGAEYVRVVPNGISADRFEGLEASNQIPKKRDDMVLLSVGRHVKRKGFEWFIEEVMTQLPDGIQYWLVGEGPETQNLHQAVGKFGLPRRVRILGKLSEEQLASVYKAADLFVMPNIAIEGDMEGFGVVMLEANLMGLPVLAANLEGIQDVVEDGENGYLLPSGDESAFIEKILEFNDNAEGLRRLGEKSGLFVGRTFSWEQAAEKLENAIRSI